MKTLPPQIVSLIHYVELTNDGWWLTTIDRCILAVMLLVNLPITEQGLRKKISEYLFIDIKKSELRIALERLHNHGDIVLHPNASYSLSVVIKNQLLTQIAENETFEKDVQNRFFEYITPLDLKLDKSYLWIAFIEKFLIPTVTQTGVKVYEMIISNPSFTSWDAPLEEFLNVVSEESRPALREAVFKFLDPRDTKVSKFILSYLDAYFVVTASGLPHSVISQLSQIKTQKVEFVIFVDTNFAFSILGLHSNPLNETAKDLMELVESVSPNVKVNFVISPITIEEAKSRLQKSRRELGENRIYYPNIAQAGITAGLMGVERRFVEQIVQSGTPMTPTDYFLPYENNLISILEEKRVNLYKQAKIEKYKEYPDVINDIEDQEQFQKTKYNRPKSRSQIEKDVILWHFVRDQRESEFVLPLQAKYWIVTVDHRYVEFDRHKTLPKSETPICMLPAHFLQILRFFAPRSITFERMMLSMMRLPLMTWNFNAQSEQVTLRIITKLSRFENVEDLSVDSVHRILADDALRSALSTNASRVDEVKEIENAVFRELGESNKLIYVKDEENIVLKQNVEDLKKISDQILTENQKLKVELEENNKKLKDVTGRLASVLNDIDKEKEDKAIRKSVKSFAFLCVLIFLPSLIAVMLTIILFSILQLKFWVYLFLIPLILIFAFFSVRLIIGQGRKDDRIKNLKWFITLGEKTSWRATLLLTYSIFLWLASTALGKIIEIIIESSLGK